MPRQDHVQHDRYHAVAHALQFAYFVRTWSIQACLKAPFGSTTYSVGRRSVSSAKPGPFSVPAYALARSATCAAHSSAVPSVRQVCWVSQCE